MARDILIWNNRITGTIPVDTNTDGGGANMLICWLGISGKGKRYSLPPHGFFSSDDDLFVDFTRDTINHDWKFSLSNDDTELIFCIWMLEKDMGNVEDQWAQMETEFNRQLDINQEKLSGLGYPEEQLNFLAFTESILQLHLTMQGIKRNPASPGFNNDEVYLPGVFHFSHVDGNTLLPTGLINEPVRNRTYEGRSSGTCYLTPLHPFSLTFKYVYEAVPPLPAAI